MKKVTGREIKIAAITHAINTLKHGDYDTDEHPNEVWNAIMDPGGSTDPDVAMELHNKYQPKLDDEYENIIQMLQKKLDKLTG